MADGEQRGMLNGSFDDENAVLMSIIDDDADAVTVVDCESGRTLFMNGSAKRLAARMNGEKSARFCKTVKRVKWRGREAEVVRLTDRLDAGGSLRLVETIIRNIPGALAEFRCEKGKPVRTYLSEDAYKILGYSENDVPASNLEEAFARVDPVDRETALNAVYEAVKSATAMNLTMRVYPGGGGVRWISFVGYPNVSFDGNINYYGIYTDITKQKARENARRLSFSGMGERRRSPESEVIPGAWRELFLQSEEMLFIKDVDLIYLAASKPFAEMLGINDPDEIIGKTDFDLFSDKKLALRYTQDDMRILHSGLNMENFVEPIAENDGCQRYSATSKYAVRDESGRIVGILGRGRDITAQISGEDRRQSDKQPANTLFRYIIKGRTMEMPQRATDEYGVPATVRDGPDFLANSGIIDIESREAWFGLFLRIDRGDLSGEAEIKTVNKKGFKRWLRMRFTAVNDEMGRPGFAIISYEDVTRRRDSDKSLSFEYMGFYSAMRMVYSLSIAVNLTQNSFYMLDSERYIRPFPRDKGVFDDLIAFGIASVPPQDKQAFVNAFSRENLLSAFERGEKKIVLEHRQYADDGSVHWIETTVMRIDNPYDTDVLEFTLARTIDEQKADEEKLKAALDMTSAELSERLRFNRMVNDIFPGLICEYYPDTGNVRSLTGNLCEMFGFKCDELKEMLLTRFKSIKHPEDAAEILRVVDEIENTRPDAFDYEVRVHKKDGAARYVSLSGKKFADKDGKDGYICLVLDSTARRELTDGLRMSGEEIKICLAKLGKFICRYDIKNNVITLPEEFAKAAGIPSECVYAVKTLHERGFKIEDDPQRVGAFDVFVDGLRKGEKTGVCEVSIIRPSGEKSWLRLEYVSIFDAEQKPARAVISVEDATVRRAYAEENKRLLQSEQIMRAVADNSDRVAYYYDIKSKTAAVMDLKAAEENGLPERFDNPPEKQLADGVIAPESAAGFREIFRRINGGAEKGEKKLRVRIKGSWRWLDMRFKTVAGQNEAPEGAVITLLDVTQLHEQELTYARYIQRMKSSDDKEVLFFETDLTRDMVEQQGGRFSPFHMRSEGLSHTDIANYIAENYFDESQRDKASHIMDRNRLVKMYEEGVSSEIREWDVVFDDGKKHWVKSDMQMVTDPYTSHIRLLTVLTDITGEKTDEIALQRQATQDGLTGVLNRAAIESRMRETIGKQPCVMILFDVDDLKKINDTMGHAQGDKVLRAVADSLAKRINKDGFLGRMGGDEFAALLPDADGRSARELLERIMDDFRKTNLSVSAGAAIKSPEETFETLYKKADAALYKVKRAGKNGYELAEEGGMGS